MFGNLATHDFPTIHTFAEAGTYYNATAQIRGRIKSEAGVPLRDNRRDAHHKKLIRNHDGSYSAVLYDTSCVTWHSDGAVTINAAYASRATAEFIYAFELPFLLYIYNWGDEALQFALSHHCPVNRYSTVQHPTFFFNSELKFTRTPSGIWDMDVNGVLPMAKRVVDRTKSAKARKPLQAFLKYSKFFESVPLSVDAASSMAGRLWRGSGTQLRYVFEDLIAEPDNKDLWGKIIAVFHESDHVWEQGKGYTSMFKFKSATMRKRLFEALYLKNGVYVYETLPMGETATKMFIKGGGDES